MSLGQLGAARKEATDLQEAALQSENKYKEELDAANKAREELQRQLET